jgi:four helix bundle protein
LLVWQKLTEFLKLTYQLVNKLPGYEEFGLKSQMRRAIISVLSNFVEGYLKFSIKHKLSYLETSFTSLQELEAQAEMCLILEFWQEEDIELFEEKRSEVAFLLFRYKSAIK